MVAEDPSQRLLEQAKAYSPGQLVNQNDVKAMFGVLYLDEIVGAAAKSTKAAITTTADFCPGVAEEFAQVMPHRLETRNGEQFVDWIGGIIATSSATATIAKLIGHSTQFASFRNIDTTCYRCGSVAISNGKCYVCPNCDNAMQFRSCLNHEGG